jgi:hypothetical protein
MACRRDKRNAASMLRFEARQALNLLRPREALFARTNEPSRSVCSPVRRPTRREVFSADCRHRAVRHAPVSRP